MLSPTRYPKLSEAILGEILPRKLGDNALTMAQKIPEKAQRECLTLLLLTKTLEFMKNSIALFF